MGVVVLDDSKGMSLFNMARHATRVASEMCDVRPM